MKHTRNTLDRLVGVVLWGCVVALASLGALAVHDYEMREAERLERVHQAGMVVGAELCAKGRS